MDITLTELKTMKAKQLRRIIREAITEVLNEVGAGAVHVKKGDTASIQKYTKMGLDVEEDPTMKENELDELARLAKGFRLADPEINSTTFTKTISGVPLSSIIDYFRQNPGAEKAQMQAHFGFVRPQIANAIVNGLLDAGILVKLSAGGEVEPTRTPGEEEEEPIGPPEIEDLFIGNHPNPLAYYFDDEPNTDGSEDVNDEEEPTVGSATTTVPTSGMSDEDYEAFMSYTDLKGRLDATKSNLNKMKRSKGRGGEPGDISDRPSTEEQRLRDLKKSLEDRIAALVSKSDYLKKRIAKETGVEPIEEPSEDETMDETIDEAFDMEYERRKLQFYAGIIK